MKSMPCSVITDSRSETIETLSKGNAYSSTTVWRNTEGNTWYEVRSSNGKRGFIYSGDVSVSNPESALSISEYTGKPGTPGTAGTLTQGENYGLRGIISSNYTITKVEAHVYDAYGRDALTAYSKTWNSTSYNIQSDGINNAFSFSQLEAGSYRYVVSATDSSGTTKKLIDSSFVVGTATQLVTFDLNGYLDSTATNDLGGYGVVDVYVNGVIVARDVNEYCADLPVGSSYEISNIRAVTGRRYNGIRTGALSGTAGSSNITVVLSFVTEAYSFIFDTPAGSYNGAMTDFSVRYGNQFTIPMNRYSKIGCRFVGWNIYRISDSEQYITDGHGWLTESEIAQYGYTKRVYEDGAARVFDDSWLTNTDGTIYSYRLKPVWVLQTYTLSFDSNGGSGSMNPITVQYTEDFVLPSNTFTKDGFEFRGWHLCRNYDDKWDAYQKGWRTIEEIEREGFEYHLFEDQASKQFDYSWIEGCEEATEFTLFAVWGPYSYGDNLTWTLDNHGTLTISGDGAMKDSYYRSDEGWLSRRSEIVEVVIEHGVTSIGDWAFSECSSLTAITIPSSVTSIGYGAFSECSSLTAITIPSGVTSIGDWAFSECSSLTAVTIPSSVTNIGDDAFYKCTHLTSITVPSSVTNIGDNAFDECSGIQTAGPVGSGCDYQFEWQESIPAYAFSGCTGLTSIIIPSGVTSIGDWAFARCYSLTSIEIPSSVTRIGVRAFYNCNGLADIAIPSSVISIGDEAFSDCLFLVRLTIPSSVTDIGSRVFQYCDGLKTAGPIGGDYNIRYGWVESIPAFAFSGCSSLTGVAVPATVADIGDSAFSGCSALSDVYYEGSQAQWDDTPKCSGNDPLTDAAFHGNYTAEETTNSGTWDNLTWSLDNDGILTISGNGAMTNFTRGSNDAWLRCRDGITGVMIDPGVTSVGSYAFSSCSRLADVTIPDSVTVIGNYAFSHCNGLTHITIPSSVKNTGVFAFYYCSGLANITISPGVTNIGNYSFSRCFNLRNVSIPSSVMGIGNSAFSGSGLTSVTIPDSVTSVGEGTFGNCGSLSKVVVGKGVTRISYNAFYNCANLTSVTIPASVTIIDGGVFSGCSGLSDVYYEGSEDQWNDVSKGGGNDPLVSASIHCNYTSVEEMIDSGEWGNLFWTFGNAGTLTISGSDEMNGFPYDSNEAWRKYRADIIRVIIEPGVVTIGENSFRDCSELISITIPSSVTRTGDLSFAECYSLTSVYIDSIESWCSMNFSGNSGNPLSKSAQLFVNGTEVRDLVVPPGVMSIGNNAFSGFYGLTSVTIPDSVTSIGYSAFENCQNLESVSLGNHLASIGSWAFSNCAGLANITIPDSVMSIDDLAFWHCSSLENISIGNGVKSIGRSVFEGCSSLTTLIIPENVTSIGDGAFEGCVNLRSVTIPDSVTSISDWTFCYCISLTNITIPDSVTSIGWRAFRECSGLQSITMGNSVMSIGEEAFEDCSSLTSVYIDSIELWCRISFGDPYANPLSASNKEKKLYVRGVEEKNLVIPSTVTNIPDYAFSGYNGVISVMIPDSVTSIGDGAFEGCTELTTVIFPSSLTRIGELAFYNCSKLSNIRIPSNVTSFGDRAFYWCSSLKTAGPIGSDCDYQFGWQDGIPAYAFDSCLSLSSVIIPDGVRSIGYAAFEFCIGLESIMIPSSVINVGDWAFAHCSGMESITIPSSVTSIGNYAFNDCANLTDVYYRATESQWSAIEKGTGNEFLINATIHFLPEPDFILPSSLIEIGDEAFRGGMFACVKIPDNTVKIGAFAFADCPNLASIYIPASVTQIDEEAFGSLQNLTVFGTEGSAAQSCAEEHQFAFIVIS